MPGSKEGQLLDVARGLVAELDLETLLRKVLDSARSLTGARYAALGILNENKGELERFLHRGISEQTAESIGVLPRGHGILGELIRDPRPLRLPDVGVHPHSYGFPPGHPEMHTFLGVPITIRGEAWGNLYLTEKLNREQFSDDDEESVTLLARWAAVAIENATLHERLVARGTELERAVRSLEATVALSKAIAGETDFHRVLELITKRGRALLGARTVTVMIQEGGTVKTEVTAGERNTPVHTEAIRDAIREVVRTKQPLRINRSRSQEASLFVPMVLRDRTRGVIAVHGALDGDTEGFSLDDEATATSFAAAAATAIFIARTVEARTFRQSLAAAEQERRRWARELHDDTLQELGALFAALENASSQPDPARTSEAIGRGLDHAQRAIEGVRTLINQLRPSALDQLGLEAALESLADRIAAEYDLKVKFELGLDEAGNGRDSRLDPELETVAYRLTQEALNNVVHHAGASTVEFTVRKDGERIVVEVTDDGQGFDPAASTTGFGLAGMRERVTLLGGRLAIHSAPGRGTRVMAELPATLVN